MPSRRRFLIGTTAVVGASAIPVVPSFALPAPTSVVLPPAAVPAAFCGVQPINSMYDFWFRLFVDDTSDEVNTNSDYPEMRFMIGKSHMFEEVSADAPEEFLRGLKKIEIRDNGFDLVRCSNWIAKQSRRGVGKEVLYNAALSKPPKTITDGFFRLHNYPSLLKNEYVVLYKGAIKYDAAIFQMVVKDGPTLYVKHHHIQHMAVRFGFGEQAFDPDNLPPSRIQKQLSYNSSKDTQALADAAFKNDFQRLIPS